MIRCLMCSDYIHEADDVLTFYPHKWYKKGGNNFSIFESNLIGDIYMLMKDKKNKYYVLCSEKCFLDKILTMSTVKTYIEEKFALIF